MVKFYKNKNTKEVRMVLDDASLKEDEIELKANTTDGAVEKHVPVISIENSSVKVHVGSITHPSLPEHHIEFIVLITDKNIVMKNLNPGDVPEAIFQLKEDEKVIKAYEYCNLHGLWVKEI